jgi:uncharacterized protein involved in exopolysaccharide biosynthesis
MTEQMQSPEDTGVPVDPRRIFIALRRQRWVIAGVAVLGTVAGAAMAKAIVEPVFEARSVIECDRCSSPDFGDRELATLQESVKLPQHLEKARQKLGLTSALESMDRDVEVGASIVSRLIHVTARGKSGELAAGLANATVDAFMETRLQVERAKLDDRLRTLMSDAEKARSAVIDARGRYDRFRSVNDIADLPAERQAAIQEAARLRSELAIAQSEEHAERARAMALRRGSSKESSTAILQEEVDLPDAKRLAAAKAELVGVRIRLSADHPRVQALTTEVEVLEQKLAELNDGVTTRQTVGRNPQFDLAQQGILAASANQAAASTRQETYEKLAQRAAQAVARLSNIEGEASQLLSSLQNAERHAASIEIDLKVADDAARKPSTGLRILAAAHTPSTPVASSRRIVALLGPLLGSLIAAMLVLLRELRGARIHTAAELAFWGKGPVLTASRWPTSPEALGDFASDVVGTLRGAKGKTLLIGAGAMEMALVQPLMRCIHEHIERESVLEETSPVSIEPFEQFEPTAALRRAVHRCDRVVILVGAGRHSALGFRTSILKIARSQPVAFVLVGLHEDHVSFPDLAGDIAAFRNSSHERGVNAEQSLPSA